MNLKYIIVFFITIFKAKYCLKKIKKSPIVIFDETHADLFYNYFNNNQIYVLDTRYKIINLKILFKSLKTYKFSWKPKYYLITFLKELEPKYIFTFIDNDLRFWSLKKYFPNVKTCFIQNGFRNNTDDVFRYLGPEDYKKYFVDHMFVFNHSIAKLYKKYINGKTYVVGSLLNNMFKKK